MKHMYRLFLSVVLVVLGLSVGGRKTAVFAQTFPKTPFTGANWVITVAVENGQPKFIWNVNIWVPGEIEVRRQTPLNCSIDPSVVVHMDHLSFSGNGQSTVPFLSLRPMLPR
ncbi:MAG: hypothetical protein H6668_01570 [Ardenticatenaceae bacterium]|nr:hypothetical protein [Ardenticatenaceae bacterium]